MRSKSHELAPPTLSTGGSVVEFFERATQENPDRTAIEAGERSLSYRELDDASNRVAARLRSLGARPDAFVVVCVDRTVDFAVAVLGVIRSGAAWVPLDPLHPRERVEKILETVEPVAAVTDGAGEALLDTAGVPRIRIQADGESLPPWEAGERPSLLPDHAAYVMFTSGSTGEPKGAVLTHGGLSSYVREMGTALRITPSDAYLHTASIGFSSSVRQILLPLTHGARVVMAGAAQIRDPASLFLEAVRRGVSIVDLVPSYWRALIDALGWLDAAERESVRNHRLRLALSASEPLPADLVRRWRAEFAGSEEFVNMYGQTETTGIVALHVVPHDLSGIGAGIPIGRAIGSRRIEILDEELRPVAPGSIGEIWIGGSGVGRGYLHREAETAASFRPEPSLPKPAPRLYRTGDLGSRRQDGTVEYRGRRDDQVKIRGVRVELDEVSRALAGEPGVRECAVLARAGATGVHQLFAWVVPNPGAALDVSTLRSRLAARLPDAMIPSGFRFLEALPRTASGKIDRPALLSSDASASEDQADGAPRTPRERTLAQIWSGVLGMNRIRRDDDFFELGGDSISAFRMIARAHARGIPISAEQVFTHSTIARLAALPVAVLGSPSEIEPVDGPLTWTPTACWFRERGLPEPNHYAQAVVLETRPDADPEQIRLALAALLSHHDALRTRWDEVDGELRARIAEAQGADAAEWFERRTVSSLGPPPREAASLLQELDPTVPGAGENEVEIAGAEAQARLDLSRGPIVRAVHFRVPGAPGRLLLCIHHAAVDGVSWRILLEDLHIACEQLLAGGSISLPSKTTSLRRVAERIAAQAASPELRSQAPFWEELAAARVPRLPRDGPSPDANTAASVRTMSAELSPEETRALLRGCTAAHGADVDEILLAALARVFSAWTGDPSFFVDIEGHGREGLGDGVDVSRTVGWFTVLWPLLLRIPAAGDGRESVREIREQYRRVRDRRRSFFLLRYLGDDATRRALSRIPPAEVRFNNLGRFDGVIPEGSLFRLTRESPGPSSAATGGRRSLIDVFANVLAGSLRFDWAYSSNVHRAETVEILLRRFMEELRTLIAAVDDDAGGDSPEFALTRNVGKGSPW
ncbi:MAG: amino acid adenylation domain-containing protein [Acidobacteriota bacterium]|nr:amino acid adenylation domain-containing protein [Acidobacteriota bacterium]